MSDDYTFRALEGLAETPTCPACQIIGRGIVITFTAQGAVHLYLTDEGDSDALWEWYIGPTIMRKLGEWLIEHANGGAKHELG